VDPEYLTTAEVAALLRVAPKTIRNKVAAGVFRQGEHFFRKPGLGPRWKREAIVHWLETDETGGVETFALAEPGGRRVA
jgi:Helix-turn-helix domain